MVTFPESTSAEAFDQYVSGRLIAAGTGQAWKDLLVRIYSEPRVQEGVFVPAVAEPHIVGVISGSVVVEERDLGGPWLTTRVEAGDFFLTASKVAYELRWRVVGSEPFQAMHLHLGLPVFARAIEEARKNAPGAMHLRDLSGFKDNFLTTLIEALRGELKKRCGEN
jgi:AraC family transcriptional regulator